MDACGAGSYFLRTAEAELRTSYSVYDINDIDFIECESEVDAHARSNLASSRTSSPNINKEQKDDKSFPYLANHHARRFSTS